MQVDLILTEAKNEVRQYNNSGAILNKITHKEF